jgi:hypothetical protein
LEGAQSRFIDIELSIDVDGQDAMAFELASTRRMAWSRASPTTKCITMCVKGTSSQYALYDGKSVLKLSDQKLPGKYAAQRVRVIGTLNEKTGKTDGASVGTAPALADPQPFASQRRQNTSRRRGLPMVKHFGALLFLAAASPAFCQPAAFDAASIKPSKIGTDSSSLHAITPAASREFQSSAADPSRNPRTSVPGWRDFHRGIRGAEGHADFHSVTLPRRFPGLLENSRSCLLP